MRKDLISNTDVCFSVVYKEGWHKGFRMGLTVATCLGGLVVYLIFHFYFQ